MGSAEEEERDEEKRSALHGQPHRAAQEREQGVTWP